MIELKIDEFKNGKVTFHISRQDKEDYEKLYNKTFKVKFQDGKEYWLCSGYHPAFYKEEKEFFVRGRDKTRDNQKMIVEFTDFLKIFELVKEYNA